MALTWTAKAPDDVVRYTWTPALAEGDSLDSYAAEADGATIDSDEQIGDEVVLFVSGGTAGETAIFTLTAETADGETLTETIYLPIRVRLNSAGNTARDVCAFALRKITGIGEDPEAAQLETALEQLNDMLAEWRMDGMDVGIPGVLVASTELAVPDEFLSAIKYNLTVRAAEDYGRELSQIVVSAAERGKMLVANRLFNIGALSFEGPSLPIRPMTGIDDL